MELTWDEFLEIATVISNLREAIVKNMGINMHLDMRINMLIRVKDKNRRVAAAAKHYQEFFNDLKYMQFIEEIRRSVIKML